MKLKHILKSLLHQIGLDVRKYNKDEYGFSLTEDSQTLIKSYCSHKKPEIFDVGANTGQSVIAFKDWFPESQITCFEPSISTFNVLKKNVSLLSGVNCVNCGVGSVEGEIILYENELSDITSFLKPTEKLWGNIKAETKVKVISLDQYTQQNDIHSVDFLKIDTQGYDFEVVKGCNELFKMGKVKLVQMEITFDDIYLNLPRIDVILAYMLDNNFRLFGFYGFHHHNKAARWTDALFIHNSVLE